MLILVCLTTLRPSAPAQALQASSPTVDSHGRQDATISAFIAARRAEGRPPNRLITETSPYLLLHAFNPVDWYPWGQAAFDKARRENKPIFLSIGYLTCHWCHVMERESFSNPTVADLLNRYFVSIKIDREERPDLDRVYMAATQALTGRGGWPMSVFLTPDRKPFYAGTYFPPEPRDGLPGFKRILETVHRAWISENRKITSAAAEITARLQQDATGRAPDAPAADEALMAEAFRHFDISYDPAHGGFGRSAKFPRPAVLNFLMHWYDRSGNRRALDMVLSTLDQMAGGGIHDHIGGGFHRYAVDAAWRVPHFEKMLYDQAQLAVACLEAYQLSGKSSYAQTAREIFDYVRRDMTSPRGAFYTAQDADSPLPGDPSREGEGAYYLWSWQELQRVLGENNAAVFGHVYGVKKKGNVEKDRWDEFTDQNILYRAHSIDATARHFRRSPEDIRQTIDDSRRTLRRLRSKRPAPRLDDKVITGWNGLMISAFARGYQILGDETLLERARQAARFIMENLYDPARHRLLRRYRDGPAGLEAHLADYAFFIQALLDLYESDFAINWLRQAVALTEEQLVLFGDDGQDRFYETSGKDPSVLLRLVNDHDGALPAANSVTALNLLRLSQMTGRKAWQQRASRVMSAFAGHLRQYPEAMPQMLVALGFSLDKPRQIIIAGRPQDPATKQMLRRVYRTFAAARIILLADGGSGQQQLAAWLPFVANLKTNSGQATAYVCRNYVCRLPTSDPDVLSELLTSKPQGGSSP